MKTIYFSWLHQQFYSNILPTIWDYHSSTFSSHFLLHTTKQQFRSFTSHSIIQQQQPHSYRISSLTFWVSGGMLFSNLYPCNSLNARKWMNLENSLTMLHYLTHFHKLNTSLVGHGEYIYYHFDSILHVPSSHLPFTNMSLPKYTLLQFDLVLEWVINMKKMYIDGL